MQIVRMKTSNMVRIDYAPLYCERQHANNSNKISSQWHDVSISANLIEFNERCHSIFY